MNGHSIRENKTNELAKNERSSATGKLRLTNTSNLDRFSSISVCLDGSYESAGVIPYAKALAGALQANLQFLHVLDSDKDSEVPPDPVEWSFRQREMSAYLEGLVIENELDLQSTEICVLEGKSASVIGNCLKNPERTIAVFCRKDDHKSGHIGATSRMVLESCARSVLLIPAGNTSKDSVQFKRIMVPLDGSPRAESILPVISGIAKYCGATIVIAHATLHPQVMETCASNTNTEMLKTALSEHNRSAAIKYLNRISRLLLESGVSVEMKVVNNGDPRKQLIDLVNKESIDLVIQSSHGHSGNADMPFGDVASHLMSRSPVPILMLRDLSLAASATDVNRLSKSNRSPEGAELPT